MAKTAGLVMAIMKIARPRKKSMQEGGFFSPKSTCRPHSTSMAGNIQSRSLSTPAIEYYASRMQTDTDGEKKCEKGNPALSAIGSYFPLHSPLHKPPVPCAVHRMSKTKIVNRAIQSQILSDIVYHSKTWRYFHCSALIELLGIWHRSVFVSACARSKC